MCVDKKAPPEIKAQAQELVGLLLFGVGMGIGTFASEGLINLHGREDRRSGRHQDHKLECDLGHPHDPSAVLMAAFWFLFRDDVLKVVATPQATGRPDRGGTGLVLLRPVRRWLCMSLQTRIGATLKLRPAGFSRRARAGHDHRRLDRRFGRVVLTTKAGAEAGFWLLWLIVIGCVIKVSTQIEFARHTIAWGRTPLKALNDVPARS